MPVKFLAPTLRVRLLVLVLLAILPLLALTVRANLAAHDAARRQALDDVVRLTRLAATQLASAIEGPRLMLATLERAIKAWEVNASACDETFRNVLEDHPGYVGIGLFETGGSFICGTEPGGGVMGSQPAFVRQVTQPALALVNDGASRRPRLLVAQPIRRPSGETYRVLVAANRLPRLDRMRRGLGLSDAATLTVFDATGNILARDPDSSKWTGRLLPAAERQAVGEGIGIDGVARFYSMARVRAELNSGLSIGVGVPRSEIFMNADAAAWRDLKLLALVFLGAIIAVVIGGETYIVGPIGALKRAALRVASGDLTTRATVASAVPGLHELGDTFNDMVAALQVRERERDQAEAGWRDAEDRYRRLFHDNPHPMWVFDSETLEFLEVNDAAILQYGYAREEFLRMKITDIRPSEDVPRLLDILQHDRLVLRHHADSRHTLKSGRIIDVDVTSHPLTFNGRPASLVVAQDVTERQQNARALAERTRVTSLTADVAMALNKVEDLGACLQACANAIREHFPHVLVRIWTTEAPDEFWKLEATAGRCCGLRCCHTLAKHPLVLQDRTFGLLTFCSREPFSEVLLTGIASIADHIALAVARKAAEEARQRAERAERETEERMRFALEASNVGVWEVAIQTGVTYWSETCEALHGLKPGSFGRTLEAFLSHVHPEDRERVLHGLEQAIQNRQKLEIEYRTVWPSGEERLIRSTARFFYDASSTPVRGAGIISDVSEKRYLEDQLRHAQKMEAIGQLAGGVAHDFNNLLTAILGYTGLLQESVSGEQARADLCEIKKAAQSAASLTGQLLAFSRKQVLQPQILNMNDVVQQIDTLLHRTIGEDVVLVPRLDGSLGTISADPGQIEQIIMNLAVNARDAMPNGGQLIIETSNVDVTDALAGRWGIPSGPHAMLAVSDTGIGMDARVRSRVFEPFFTTKPEGKGTGLGLATVYGIVKQSGGAIRVQSKPGRGTSFKIYFPRVAQPADRQPAPSASFAEKGTETILVVEDQDEVRAIVRKALASHGYVVLEASCGREALEILGHHHAPIHLMLTDVVMPTMSGRELAERVRATHPDIRALFMSGYTDDTVVRNGIIDANVAFIQKPFSPELIRRKIREVLEEPLVRAG